MLIFCCIRMPLHIVLYPKRISSCSFVLYINSVLFASFSQSTSFRFYLSSSQNQNTKTQSVWSVPRPALGPKSLVFYFASLLQSCIVRKAIEPGKQLHARICLMGLGFNPFLGTKLVNLYCICNSLTNARLLFDRISKRSLFLWNVMIRGYAWNGPYDVAILLYHQMQDCGFVPDKFTFPFVLKACSALSAVEDGMKIHRDVLGSGLETDVFVGAALIDMYAKCGCVESARQVFDKIAERDVVCWNSMLAAYSQNGQPDDCLALCRMMALAGVNPTEGTLVIAISATADSVLLPRGKELHSCSWRHGFGLNDKVITALVDMYAKSGSVNIARSLFKMLGEKRVVSWNTMITGYAMHGHAYEALDLFEEMKGKVLPDHITFVGVLAACSHGGLLDKGKMYFKSMVNDYLIRPTVQHYTCMIDLLGHCGHLEEAFNLIMEMRVDPDAGVWGALLHSCKIHGNMEMGEIALEKLMKLEPDEGGNYVILSNMYAQAGKWEGVARLRDLMMDRGLRKSIACSWIEVRNKVHAFLSEDTSHPESEAIYAELKRIGKLMKEAGYAPQIGSVFHDVADDEKVDMVCSHSERLAIAFGLISTAAGTRLLIIKNLRICEDCHVAIKFISKITEREITIRDVNRYHHFKDGLCSCGDFW